MAPVGAIRKVSDSTFIWDIPGFYGLIKEKELGVHSPDFTFGSTAWDIGMYKTSDESCHFTNFSLWRKSYSVFKPRVTATYRLYIKDLKGKKYWWSAVISNEFHYGKREGTTQALRDLELLKYIYWNTPGDVLSLYVTFDSAETSLVKTGSMRLPRKPSILSDLKRRGSFIQIFKSPADKGSSQSPASNSSTDSSQDSYDAFTNHSLPTLASNSSESTTTKTKQRRSFEQMQLNQEAARFDRSAEECASKAWSPESSHLSGQAPAPLDLTQTSFSREVIYRRKTWTPGSRSEISNLELIQNDPVNRATPPACGTQSTNAPSRTLKTISKATQTFNSDCADKLIQDLKEAFLNHQHHDVTLRVGTTEFRAYRAILKARSPVFSGTFQHDSAAGTGDVLEIPDCNPSDCHKLLLYLYTGSVGELTKDNAVGIYEIAKKYGVRELVEVCAEFMLSNLDLDTFCRFVRLALRHSEPDLLETARIFFAKNTKDVIATSEWPSFIEDNPSDADEMLIKVAAAELTIPTDTGVPDSDSCIPEVGGQPEPLPTDQECNSSAGLQKSDASSLSQDRASCKATQTSSTRDKLVRDLRDMLLSGKDADVTLKVKNKEFPSHRGVLMARSPVFSSRLLNRHNNTAEECVCVVADLTDGEADEFHDFLLYLYTGAVDNLTSRTVVRLYRIADKYGVREMAAVCVRFMVANLSLDTFCDFAALALRHRESDLVGPANAFFEKNMKDVIVSTRWRSFITENATEANELLLRAVARRRMV